MEIVSVVALWGAGSAGVAALFLGRARLRRIDERARQMKDRIPPRNRFIPDHHEPDRSAALVEQIIGDQQAANQTPGGKVKVPAPGEPGYVAPNEELEVPAGEFTLLLGRNHIAAVRHRLPNGEEQTLAVPTEWEDVFATFGMEILRLREGWDINK